jgi:hypothetical protein
MSIKVIDSEGIHMMRIGGAGLDWGRHTSPNLRVFIDFVSEHLFCAAREPTAVTLKSVGRHRS